MKTKESRFLNLRQDAQFEISTGDDLKSYGALEIKVLAEDKENIVLLRYLVFQPFTQNEYSLIYIVALRRLIGAMLARG